MLDAALRPQAFPPETGSLLPGLLAATRTGPSPAGDDELVVESRSQISTSNGLGAPPITVEALRARLRETDDYASATLVVLLAYAGLRPGEATALTWEHIREHTLLVEASRDTSGATTTTKTKTIRTVRVLEPLASDLREWRARSGEPADDALVIRRADGHLWTPSDYRNWRRRHFDPATAALGREGIRPYDLRHSFASLMIQAGYSPVELAAELGHSPTLTLDTYAHLFSEFARGKRVDPVWEILRARESRPHGALQQP